MSQVEAVIEKLRKDGVRITTTRRLLLEIFLSASTPLTVQLLLERLTKRGSAVNKTTVYRELDFLTSRGLVHELQLQGEGMKRYEYSSDDHHHHILCEECGAIADVDIHGEMDRLSADIRAQSGYTLTDHAIEFVGVCASCQQKR